MENRKIEPPITPKRHGWKKKLKTLAQPVSYP
jgi:hypothetical protein